MTDIVERTREIATKARADHDRAAAENRRRMPEFAAFLDRMARFGPFAKVRVNTKFLRDEQ